MKSAEVYRLISEKISPILSDIGFKKIRGSRPRWFFSKNHLSFYVYLKTDKYPWEPYRGCDLKVQLYVCKQETELNDVELFENSKSLFAKGSSEMLEIQERSKLISEKIKNVDLVKLAEDPNYWCNDLALLKSLHRDPINYLEHRTKLEVLSTFVDTPLYYLDKDDVDFWGDFLLKNIEHNLKRIFHETKFT